MTTSGRRRGNILILLLLLLTAAGKVGAVEGSVGCSPMDRKRPRKPWRNSKLNAEHNGDGDDYIRKKRKHHTDTVTATADCRLLLEKLVP